ncbi:unannotated protein [freshwater metagenome]|uniref:Unannotated protein n=3 Tax=freshwater metagenome TaxID=449393 RepID=A0A6J6CFW7_9ZZZZ|nr:DUF3048 domain-containing protein [Actinomycetota bacterium]MTA68557.1 DUF3048 domain-containing protein [Actinomycetota bacterium]
MKIYSSPFTLACIGTFLVVSCGGGSGSTDSVPVSSTTSTIAVTSSSTATTIPVAGPVMPLTGLPAADGVLSMRPALVVKVDNHPGARPQSGLNQADIVFEENVEALTRFALVFHSQGSDPVGPIRSGRTQDIDLLTSLNGVLFVWSGGNAGVTAAVKSSNFINMSASAAGKGSGFFRSDDKKAPHNLYTNTSDIWAVAAGRGGTPPPQFLYSADPSSVNGDDVVGVKLRMDGSMKASWEWDANKRVFARRHDDKLHLDSNGEQVSTENVLVLTVEYKISAANKKSPEAQTTGTGVAWVLQQGKFTQGTWTRASEMDPWTLTDATGEPILLTPGRTFVELIRKEQAVIVASGESLAATAWP